MDETKFTSDNFVFKEYAFPHLILLCLYTLLHLVFVPIPILFIIEAQTDSVLPPIIAYVVAGIVILLLLATYIIGLSYMLFTIKNRNLFCDKDDIYIRYGNRWIVKFKYSEIVEYGDVYFHGQYINVKKSLHYKRGEQTNKQYSFYLNKEDKVRFYDLIKSKAKNIKKIL